MNSKAQSYNLVFVTEFNGPSEPKTTAVRYNEVPQHSSAGCDHGNGSEVALPKVA